MNVFISILTSPPGVFKRKFKVDGNVVKMEDGFHLKIPYLKVLNSYGACMITGMEAELDGRIIARQSFGKESRMCRVDDVITIGESEVLLEEYRMPKPVVSSIPHSKMLADMYKTHKPTPAEKNRFKETLYDLFDDEEFDYGKPTGLKRIDDGL